MTNLLVNHDHVRPLTISRISRAREADLRLAFQLFSHLLKRAPLSSASHQSDHALRMLNNLEIIKDLAGDLRLVRLAVVLHDVGLFYSQDQVHGPASAQKIRPHLGDLRLDKEEQDRLCSIIRAHDDPSHVDNSPEAQALKVLDTLDCFGEIGVFRYLEINWRRGLRPPEIFNASVRSIATRRHYLPLHWFRIEDQRTIQAAYMRAYELMSSNGGARAAITAGLNSIGWNPARTGVLLLDPEISENTVVKQFFTDLLFCFIDAKLS